MGTRDSSNGSPRHRHIPEDVINEDRLKTIASFCRNRHATNVPIASFSSSSTPVELANERSEHSSTTKVLGSVVSWLGSSHDGLASNYNVVSKRNNVAPILVNLTDVKLVHALDEAHVIWVVKVDACIGAALVGVLSSEVHEVMACESQGARGILSSDVDVVLNDVRDGVVLGNDLVDNLFELPGSQELSGEHGISRGTGEVFTWVVDGLQVSSRRLCSLFTTASKTERTLGSNSCKRHKSELKH